MDNELPRTVPPPSPAFLDRVKEYLGPVEGHFNHEQMVHTYISTQRFEQWTGILGQHTELAGATVLSSGCGVGGSLLAHWAAGAARVVGVEIDDALVEMAVLHSEGLAGVEVRKYPGHPLPFPGATFDVVESLDVLEHVPDSDRYLGELARVLRPAGCILLVTPNRLWPVEQHVNVAGPPWLPVTIANLVYPWLAARVERRSSELAWRLKHVPVVREQNISFRRLRALARRHGLFLELLHPSDHRPPWPLPPVPEPVARMARHPYGKFVAPTRTLATLLWKRA